MRAALLTGFSRPLQLREVPEPDAVPGEVLIEVRAVGLCGSDLKLLAGATPGTSLPLIPGHEVAGVVARDGDRLRRGQRVACYLYESCGVCRWCRRDQEVLCPSTRRLGRNRDGGLAEYVRVSERVALPFTDTISFAEAAVSMDAVTTPWHALLGRASLGAEDQVLVVGAGGLGLHAVQIAAARAVSAAVIDPVADRRDAALELGAGVAVDPGDAGRLRGWPDVVIEASGTEEGFRLALECVAPGGRIACCGYRPGSSWTVDSARLSLGEISLLGSRAGRLDDAVAALRALEAGEVRAIIDRHYPLDEVNDAVDALRQGRTVGRVVVDVT
jgi:D-arabinose 1-dehydrogenase-like Zn-dependent alcohol dehydrogenase